MLTLDQIFEFRHGDLRFALGHLRVLPLGLGSGHGSVRGGIHRTAEHPDYFDHRRFVDGAIESITKWRHPDPSIRLSGDAPPPVDHDLAVYLGPAHRHFGHFAVESLSRAWMAHLAGGLFGGEKVRFVVLPELTEAAQRETFSFDDLLPWQIEIYHAIGATKRNTTLLTQPAIFTRLVVPEQAVLYGGAYQPDAAKIVSSFPPAETISQLWPDNERRIFLTRGFKYIHSGYVAGTRYLEQFFADNGYVVVDNDNIGVTKQLAWAQKAKSVMAVQSSSLHIFNVFGRPATRLAYLKRLNPKLDRYMTNSLMGLVNLRGALDCDEHVEPPGLRQLRERLCVFSSLDRLKTFFAKFDPALDMGTFDDAAYLDCVGRDVELVRGGGA